MFKSSKPKSQTEAIIKHLKRHKKITQAQATDLYGCLRLSGIIYVLRHKKGFEIRTEPIVVKNRFGTTSEYGIYHLVKAGE